MTDTAPKYGRLTARPEITTVRALEALARVSGVSRHAVLLAAIRKGVALLTVDELRATLPDYRLG